MISAPSKVLINGAYLILKPEYQGMVLSTSARIYCFAEEELTELESAGEENWTSLIQVSCKQLSGDWEFKVSYNEETQTLTVKSESDPNPFLSAAIQVAFSQFFTSSSKEDQTAFNHKILTFHILTDNWFYSTVGFMSEKNLPPTLQNTQSLTKFEPIPSTLGKTGLGSSACVTSSFLTCLLTKLSLLGLERFNNTSINLTQDHSQFLANSTTTSLKTEITADNFTILNILSQLSNTVAQKKIGSGFDIASALNGSIVYSRSSVPDLGPLADCFVDGVVSLCQWGGLIGDALEYGIKKRDCVTGLKWPSALKLVLCDVNHGSDTRKMVRQVLEWMKTDPESGVLIEELNGLNVKLSELILSRGDQDIANDPSFAEESRQLCKQVRAKLKEMGQRSGTEIEPDAQSKLLDQIFDTIEGTVYCSVPGAGGYDALFCLGIGEDYAEKIDAFTKEVNLTGTSICILPVSCDGDVGVAFHSLG